MKKILAMMLTAAMMLSMGTAAMAASYDADGNLITSQPNGDEYVDTATVKVSKTYKLRNDGMTSPAETFEFTTLVCDSIVDAGIETTGSNAGNVVTTATAPVPTIDKVSYSKGDAGKEDSMTKEFTITLPPYNAVGIYTYTFNEIDGGTAGVTYDTGDVTLVVTVVEQDGKVRVAAVHCENPVDPSYPTEGEAEDAVSTKTDKFDNEYSAGTLAVSKEVTGNLADKEEYFKVTVTFTAPDGDTVKSDITISGGSEHTHVEDCYGKCTSTEDNHTHTDDCLSCEIEKPTEISAGTDGWTGTKAEEIWLKHGDTITFTNIPYGVTYTVAETIPEDYTATYEYTGTVEASGMTFTADLADTIDTGSGEAMGSIQDVVYTIDEENSLTLADMECHTYQVKITNNKESDVDTGISVDSIPYIAMLGVVAIGGTGFMVSKKRRSED